MNGPALLRVGVILEGTTVPAWIARVLHSIQMSGHGELAVVIRGERAAPARDPLPVRVLRRLYDAFDARAFTISADPLAPTDVSELLGAVPVSTLEDAGRHRLDVAIDFADAAVADPAIARFGVWSHVYGDEFRDVLTRSPVSRAALHDSQGRVLVQSWSRTDPHSVRRNRKSSYWKATSFVARALRMLHEHGAEALERGGDVSPPAVPNLATGLARFGRDAVADRARRLVARNPWILAYGIDPSGSGSVPTRRLADLAPIIPPRDRFWADPCVVRHGDGWVVFFEEKLYAQPHARISMFEIDRTGQLGPPVPVVETDYHLSYPFVFEWNGAWWMIPESSRNKTVELWRATSFPTRWERERILLDGVQAVDATLLEHDGAWWMFVNLCEEGASKDDELHIFYATSPLGPWLPHSGNPVKSDVRCARPAGRLFREHGVLYRPAQDGSGGYGSRIILHRVERLDRDSFDEVEVARISPDWMPGCDGLHTISACDGLTVIDLRVWRSRLRIFDRFA